MCSKNERITRLESKEKKEKSKPATVYKYALIKLDYLVARHRNLKHTENQRHHPMPEKQNLKQQKNCKKHHNGRQTLLR